MALTDISLLFKDIIETPQQKQQRLFAEGQAAAGQYTGLPTGLRELAMGTASGIPNMVESIRQFGAAAGLPVQTQGEQMQGAMANFNVDDPNSRMAVYRQLRDIDPMRAIALGEMLKDRDSQQATAAEEARLRGLQIENEIETKQARRDAQLFERTQTLRAQEEITTRRSSMIDMASKSKHLSLDEKAQIEEFITGGGYDDNAEDFFARAMPESDWKPIGENNYYDPVTKTWLIVPANRAGGNLGATNVLERFAISARIYDPGSMARLNTEIARINNIEGLSTVERFALEEEAVNTLLKPKIEGEKWVEYPAWDEDGNDILDEDGNIVMEYFPVPGTSAGVSDTHKELNALNARNRTLVTHSSNGLGAIERIEADLAQAEADGVQIVGSVWDVIQSLFPGRHGEYEIASEIDNLYAILGLTGLAEARQGAASGASGFGQLTQSEMQILQDRIASLRQGASIEKFREDLGIIKAQLQTQKRIGSVVLKYNEYINVRPRPKPPQVLPF